jgi:tetratricopeptide (TPR) repeat protein
VKALLFPLAALMMSCAPTYAEGYQAAFDEGLRAKNAGRWQEAAVSFDKAADLGARYKDRDEARLLYAEALERMEKYDEAEAAYRKVETESGGRYHGQRAAFAVGRIVWEQRGFEAGSAETLRAVRTYPQSGLVRHAVKRLLDHVEETQGPEAALAWLTPIEKELHDTEAGEAVTYEYGTLLARCDRKEDSLKALLALARAHPYPHGSLTDDAYYMASLRLEELGRPKEAVAVLEEMVAPFEAAYLGSSYRRPRWPEGAFRVAVLWRDKLNDRPRAKREFWRVYNEHFTSRFTDDALWEVARMERDDKKEDEACRALTVLKEKKPDSRYNNCLHLLCSKLERGPRGCSRKVVEDLGLDPDSEWDDRAVKD